MDILYWVRSAVKLTLIWWSCEVYYLFYIALTTDELI